MMPRCPPHACHIVRVSRPIKVTFRPTGVPMWALRRHGGESAGRPRISNRRDLRTEKDDLPSNLKLNVAAVRAPKV